MKVTIHNLVILAAVALGSRVVRSQGSDTQPADSGSVGFPEAPEAPEVSLVNTDTNSTITADEVPDIGAAVLPESEPEIEQPETLEENAEDSESESNDPSTGPAEDDGITTIEDDAGEEIAEGEIEEVDTEKNKLKDQQDEDFKNEEEGDDESVNQETDIEDNASESQSEENELEDDDEKSPLLPPDHQIPPLEDDEEGDDSSAEMPPLPIIEPEDSQSDSTCDPVTDPSCIPDSEENYSEKKPEVDECDPILQKSCPKKEDPQDTVNQADYYPIADSPFFYVPESEGSVCKTKCHKECGFFSCTETCEGIRCSQFSCEPAPECNKGLPSSDPVKPDLKPCEPNQAKQGECVAKNPKEDSKPSEDAEKEKKDKEKEKEKEKKEKEKEKEEEKEAEKDKKREKSREFNTPLNAQDKENSSAKYTVQIALTAIALLVSFT